MPQRFEGRSPSKGALEELRGQTRPREASRFWFSRTGGISVASLHAGRRVALRHDNLIAVGRRRRDQRRRQVATARRSCACDDVIHTRRGLYGSRSRCTTCRGQHRRRCGGYQKIQVPHITNVASCIVRASSRAQITIETERRFELTRRGRAPSSDPVEIAAGRQSKARR